MALESVSVVVGNELDEAERGTALNVPISRGTRQRLTPLQTRSRKRHTPSEGAREGIPVIRPRVLRGKRSALSLTATIVFNFVVYVSVGSMKKKKY